MRYSQDACPAVMAVVMAECRVRLWRLMMTAGLENVVYVDTDSVITNPEGASRLALLSECKEQWGLRLKDSYKHLTILGPRQLVVNGQQRIAGVPRKASNIGDGYWLGERWQTLPTALANQTADR